jgi:hypothetical protein
MAATIHAKTATVFVALGMRDKAVASILTATTMVANDIFLFTHATGFRHSLLPSLEPSSMRTVYPKALPASTKKSIP